MVTTDIKQAVNRHLDGLSLEDQERVLSFVESMDALPDGLTLEQMKRFGGTIAEEDADQMRAAVEEGCERVDADA